MALKNASRLVRCLMELGGNDPLIVMPDADLDKAAATTTAHRFALAGQSCAAVKRLLVHKNVHHEMRDRLAEAVSVVRLGDPTDDATTMGPVIDEASAAEIERRVNEAMQLGARRLAGGSRLRTLVAPTLLDEVPTTAELVRTETFGPVVAIQPFDSIEAVINDIEASPYGLQAGVFTNDHSLIKKLGRELRVGGVMINEGPDFRTENVPFGGIKSSGLGREGVHVMLREMSEQKVVID